MTDLIKPEILIAAQKMLDEAEVPTKDRSFWCPFCNDLHNKENPNCEELLSAWESNGKKS